MNGMNRKSKMDEVNQQTSSDTIFRDSLIGDSEPAVKGFTDEEVEEPLPRKSSSEISSISVDALNANGMDKEAYPGDTFHSTDLESPVGQETKTFNDDVCNKSNPELIVASKDVDNSLKECVNKQTDSEIHISSVDSENVDSSAECSKRGDVSDCQINKEENFCGTETTSDGSGSQLVEGEGDNGDSNLFDANECNKNEYSQDVTKSKESSREEIIVEKEVLNPLTKKSSEKTSVDFCIEEEAVTPSCGAETHLEVISPLKEVVKEIQLLKNVETKNNSYEFNSDIGKLSNKTCTIISEIDQITEEQNEAKEKCSDPVLPNEGSGKEEQISQEEQFIKKSDNNEIIQLTDKPNKQTEKDSPKPVLPRDDLQEEEEEQISQESQLIEESVTSKINKSSYKQNEEANSPKPLHPPKDSPEEQQVSLENQQTEKSSNEIDITCQEIEELSEIEIQKTADKEDYKSAFPLDVDSDSEITDPQEETKSDDAEDSESSQNILKNDINESKNFNANSENKSDSAQECSSDQIRNTLSTSTELEEENTNKSANEGNEILETELVNCTEIEQVDINENEADLKNDNRDEEMAGDSLETTGEKSSEDQLTNVREANETEKNEVLIAEEGVNQPGSSEEETITGDTTNQPSTDLAKEKDEEVCIIPDDMIPALSILPKSKVASTEGEEEGMKTLKESHLELEKPKTRAQDKRSQATDSKPRPVRNAAKLAGNKIKSLVESDLVFEEQGSGGDVEEEMDIQENADESTQICAQCREVKVCKLLSVQNDSTHYLCSEQCSAAFKTTPMDTELTETESTLREYVRKCSQCHAQITADETRLFWETMDFCNEDCLGKYQLELGSNCANCKKSVPSTSLGKYCVRFGYDIKQFCSAICLEEYKKGLKVCSYCQKDISTGVEGFLAPVGTKGQFKDFCTQSCMEKYDRMSSNKPLPDVIEECAVCSNSKPVQVEVELDNKTHKLCSEPCFAAFKFVNNITEGQCDMCRKYFDRSKMPKFSLRLLFYDETLHSFCSKTCMNVYILANRKIVPCNWCKVKKYNFDMIRKISSDGQLSMMCSLNCLMLYQTSVNAVCSRPLKCDFCKKKFVRQPLYHLTMSDATLRNFCSYNCVMSFQNGYPKQKIDVIPGADQLGSPIPTGGPKRLAPKRPQVESTCVPVISSVQSLASPNGPVSPSGRVTIPRGDVNLVSQVGQPLTVQASVAPMPAPPPQVYQQVITKPAPTKQMKNKSVLCKPYSHTKGVSCRPHPCMKETQTDQSLNRKFLIPIPVPIYVPAPMHMFSAPFPVPVPFPLPIPVPIFIPTTRNSAKGIMKEIKKIQEKIPTDPFEAELLMMAEMVAGEKKQDPTDSESEDGNEGDDNGDGTFSPENVDTSNTFGDDMLQMALKMASELEEPAVDMESVLTSNTITTTTQPAVDPNKTLYASDTDDPDQVNVMAMNRGRKRSVRGSRNSTGGTPSKRGRRTSGSVDVPLLPPPEPVPPRTIEVEKPDANMCLKYTFGVNAWRHWVMQKNAELEKAALINKKIKLFKPELLQLTADELNFSLCLFVKEVRKPNGTEYAPDTIYYLCLGIQQYLFENGRIDNIFTDSYYEKFTDCLDEVAKKFAALYNDSQYIVTRVEEEHLWESKQLGAHSPHVLLSTLMFFNTKHFNLVTVEEHMQLSFSHIMKHWKRNPNTPGVAKVPGSRNVLLRFYPPQSALEANSRKKKVYEQQENEENPLRCPVKLYEFYLSKCPESVKTRNDVFYLLPERSCVPDSPVWYSTMALGKEPLMKMLHRIKMVKEINIALLTS